MKKHRSGKGRCFWAGCIVAWVEYESLSVGNPQGAPDFKISFGVAEYLFSGLRRRAPCFSINKCLGRDSSAAETHSAAHAGKGAGKPCKGVPAIIKERCSVSFSHGSAEGIPLDL